MTALPLPLVLVPATQRVAALDACLASLERTLPAGARVLVADHAAGHPQVEALAQRWCARSRTAAEYRRAPRPLGLAANIDAALADTGEDDVAVMLADAVATPGWLERMAQYARKDERIATVSAWSNRSALCAFPRPGEDNPVPAFPEQIAEAAGTRTVRCGWTTPTRWRCARPCARIAPCARASRAWPLRRPA